MEYPRPTWEEFQRSFMRRWKQGEHVFINGQTGSGKTELLLQLVNMRTYGVVFVTKPRDPIFKSPFAEGYHRKSLWNPKLGEKKILLAPKEGDSTQAQVGAQREVFLDALN